MVRLSILGMHVNIVSMSQVVSIVRDWVMEEPVVGRYVCVSNVHMAMESFDNIDFKRIVNNSDLTVPDGKPLVWMQKLLGARNAAQVRGADLTDEICKLASAHKIPIGFYGSTPEVLGKLCQNLRSLYPKLDIVYSYSPPFRGLNDEDEIFTKEINGSGAKLLLVGLGCPKQEIWMAKHKDDFSCVMFGVGAAFDFIAGNKKHAPKWMQYAGLEWFFRLVSEPKRLWKRYLKHNPRFVYHSILQLLGKKYI